MSAAIASLEGSVRLQVVRKGELIYDKDDGNQATAYCKTLVLWGIMNDGVVGSYPEHGGPNYVRCTSQTTGDAAGQVFAANADATNSGRDIGNTGINVVTLTSHDSDAGNWQSIDTVVDGSNSSANKMVFELEANSGSSASGYAPGKCADHIHTIGASETLQIGDKYRVIWTLTVGNTHGLINHGLAAGAEGLLATHDSGYTLKATQMGQSDGDPGTVAGQLATNGHFGLNSTVTAGSNTMTASFPNGADQWRNAGLNGIIANATNVLGFHEWSIYQDNLANLPADSARVGMSYVITVT